MAATRDFLAIAEPSRKLLCTPRRSVVRSVVTKLNSFSRAAASSVTPPARNCCGLCVRPASALLHPALGSTYVRTEESLTVQEAWSITLRQIPP
jgi:hypothetical protein